MGVLRLSAGIAMWPLAWSAWRAVAAVLGAVGMSGPAEPVAWAAAGFAAFSLVWVFAGRPVRAYVLAHELTHALFGILCGARVGKLEVAAHGGSVTLSKSNMLITLSPYFFPFYVFILALAALAARLAAGALPCPPAWLAAAGFLWGFHCHFTVAALATRQPDVIEYGRVFSWTLILLANAAFFAFSLAAAGSVPPSIPAKAALSGAAEAYSAVWRTATRAADWTAGLATDPDRRADDAQKRKDL